MKRAIAALLAILTIAQPLLAATDPPKCGQATSPPGCDSYQQFRYTTRTQRVAIIRPDRWSVLAASNMGAIRRNHYANLGNIRDALENHGIEVHDYNTNFFEQDHNGSATNAQDKREMWSDLGSKYAVAIVLCGETNVAGFARYVCADSTNVQLIVVGGGGNNGWRADTTVRGFVDSAQPVNEGYPANGACAITYDGVDTLWAQRLNSGRRMDALASGISGVRRVLHPVILGTPKTWNQTSDSTLYDQRYPAMLDSTADARELLGPMWNVAFTNNLAGAVPGAQNGVAGGGPREVYWLKWPAGNAFPYETPHLLWSLVSRFTVATPLKYAYDWDDVTDKFQDSKGQPPRWRASAVESSLAGLRAFGVVPTLMLNPSHARDYIRGDTPYTYGAGATLSQDTSLSTGRRETAWSGPSHSYLAGMTWVHHSHDSTQKSIASSLLGRYGGYTTGNGSVITEASHNHETFGYRYASRWNPLDSTAAPTARGAGTAGGRWGIIQRLAWSDSVRRVVAPGSTVPPFIVHPAGMMLPKNWRARTPATNWHSYASDAASCPIDSVLWALDSMLVRGNGRDGRKLYIGDWSFDPRYQHYQHDRDSVVATSIFLYPNEKHTTRVSGRLVQAVSVKTFVQGPSSRAEYLVAAVSRANRLIGLKNPITFNDVSNQQTGEGYDHDTQGVYDGATAYHDWNYKQSSKLLTQHPGQGGDLIAAHGDYMVDIFVLAYGTQYRMMDKIAGRSTTRCVPAWHVYEKK